MNKITVLCLLSLFASTSLFGHRGGGYRGGDNRGGGEPYYRYGYGGSAASFQVETNPANYHGRNYGGGYYDDYNYPYEAPFANQVDVSAPGDSDNVHFDKPGTPPAWQQ